MSIDLKKLEHKLDEALSNETNETLTKFLTDKRMSNNKQSSIKILFEHFENIVEILPTIYWYRQSFRQKFGKGVIVVGWLKWGLVIYLSKKQ